MGKKQVLLFLVTGVIFAAGCGDSADKKTDVSVQQGQEIATGQDILINDAGKNNMGAQDARGDFVENSADTNKNDDTEKNQDTGETQADYVQNTAGMDNNDDAENKQNADHQYIWQELTITLPDAWKDRVVIRESEDGVFISHKASYDEDAESGFLCSFYRTKEYTNYAAGETLIAYTDDGTLYYMTVPTDVACSSEDEAVLNEYIGMAGQTKQIKETLQINVKGIHYDAEEYIFPVSHMTPIEEMVLVDMSDNQLRLARNEIYARHGRQFTNEYLQNYFDSCSWYEGSISPEDFSEEMLSQVERDNLEIIVAAEKKYDENHPYPKKYVAGQTVYEDLHQDGTPNKIKYEVTESSGGSLKCEITIDGTSYDVTALTYLENPMVDVFYVTDILEGDGQLEIAVLDEGASDDYTTSFFWYREELSHFGKIQGFPFAEYNNGVNGFNGWGGVTGNMRIDLIDTAFVRDYSWYDREKDWIVSQDTGWSEYSMRRPHQLYEDLTVYYDMDETSETTVIPPQEKVFFIGTDRYEWILVKGKDGSKGYMQVKDGKIVGLNKSADQVFSDLYYFD